MGCGSSNRTGSIPRNKCRDEDKERNWRGMCMFMSTVKLTWPTKLLFQESENWTETSAMLICKTVRDCPDSVVATWTQDSASSVNSFVTLRHKRNACTLSRNCEARENLTKSSFCISCKGVTFLKQCFVEGNACGRKATVFEVYLATKFWWHHKKPALM